MTGNFTISQILTTFTKCFGFSIAQADFQAFSKKITNYALLEFFSNQSLATTSIETLPSFSYKKRQLTFGERNKQLYFKLQYQQKARGKVKKYIWVLPNPEAVFIFLTALAKPYSLVFQILAFVPIVTLPMDVGLFMHHTAIIMQEIQFISTGGILFLTHILLNMMLIGLVFKASQSTVFASYGGKVKKFGISLTMGFHPRFYVDRTGMLPLSRKAQLWTFATPLIVRAWVISLNLIIWYLSWETGTSLGTSLSTFALLLAHSAFFEFLLDGSPLLPTNGYYMLITLINKDPTYIKRVIQVWSMVSSRRSLPKALSNQEKLFILLFGFFPAFHM